MAKGQKIDLITPILVLLLIVSAVMAAGASAPMWIFMVILGLALFTIGLSAIRNLVLFKIGARSLLRRRGMSLIVIAGLMIGTVIISSSLVIGDTMDRMITQIHYDDFHEVDEVIYAPGVDDEYLYFPESDVSTLIGEIEDIDNVEGATAILETSVVVIDVNSGQTEPAITLVGFNTTSTEFGVFEVDGKDVPMELGADETYVDTETAKALDASVGDTLVIPTMTGEIQVTIKEIVDHEGRAHWWGNCIFMNLEDAQVNLGLEGIVNKIIVTNDGGVRSGEDHCDAVVKDLEEVLEGNQYGLQVQEDKHSEVEQGREEMKMFTQMFLIFGSFSIIAGVILIINIFVMLGEERKGEMGISRAIGMTRPDLKKTFVYEGTLYSIASSVVGAFLGIGVAYLIIYGMEIAFASTWDDFSVMSNFNFEVSSIVYAMTFGLLISLVTVSFAASRINKLNIVRAIRGIPEPKLSKDSNRMLIAGSAMLLLGLALFGSGMVLFDDLGISRWEGASIYTGLSTALIGAAIVFRRMVGDRLAFSLASVALIVLWLVPAKILRLDMYEADIEMFILSGVFVVTAGIILFINNSNQLMNFFMKIWSMLGRPIATVKTASSYPMKNKFRTGMTIYMFALIVFTITVMSMIVGVLSANIERITEEQMGNVEILGVSSSHYQLDDVEMVIEENPMLDIEDFNGIYVMTAGNSIIDNGEKDPQTGESLAMELSLCGVDENFHEAGWGFKARMEGFDTDEDVWNALQTDPKYIVVDGTFDGDEGWSDEYAPFTVSPGDPLMITSQGAVSEKVVVGILEQNLISGVIISKEAAESEFNITRNTLFLFDVADGVDQEELALDIERELGMETHVLSVFVKMVTRSMEQMFDLFSAFMGLGLVVGIAGLGIITLRAVHERRLEIGMMRAIGFQRHSVTWSFLMEAGFIALTGILLGTFLGIGLGYTLWFDEFKPYDYDFFIPWLKILIVGGIALLATLAFTIPPSFSASRVAPAEALRYD